MSKTERVQPGKLGEQLFAQRLETESSLEVPVLGRARGVFRGTQAVSCDGGGPLRRVQARPLIGIRGGQGHHRRPGLGLPRDHLGESSGQRIDLSLKFAITVDHGIEGLVDGQDARLIERKCCLGRCADALGIAPGRIKLCHLLGEAVAPGSKLVHACGPGGHGFAGGCISGWRRRDRGRRQGRPCALGILDEALDLGGKPGRFPYQRFKAPRRHALRLLGATSLAPRRGFRGSSLVERHAGCSLIRCRRHSGFGRRCCLTFRDSLLIDGTFVLCASLQRSVHLAEPNGHFADHRRAVSGHHDPPDGQKRLER